MACRQAHPSLPPPSHELTRPSQITAQVSFCAGRPSEDYPDDQDRLVMSELYDIELRQEKDIHGKAIAQALVVKATQQGPILIEFSDVDIVDTHKPGAYDYNLGVVFDTFVPEYLDDTAASFKGDQGRRDGNWWVVPLHKSTCFDQNSKAKYQLTLRANDEIEGAEEGDDGAIHITMVPMRKTKSPRPMGRMRGCSSSKDASIGYGQLASTSSVPTEYRRIPGTKYYGLPVKYTVPRESRPSQDAFSRNLSKRRAIDMSIPFARGTASQIAGSTQA
eukprot:52657-Hanusia_phi.AAC.6